MRANTVTIELPAQLYTQLQTLAADQRTELVELLNHLVSSAAADRPELRPAPPAFQRILDQAAGLGADDLSRQHEYDHYATRGYRFIWEVD